jgi:hypothetical protein
METFYWITRLDNIRAIVLGLIIIMAMMTIFACLVLMVRLHVFSQSIII